MKEISNKSIKYLIKIVTQQSPSAKLESTWGKFSTKQAAKKTQTKLKEANIAPEKITVLEKRAKNVAS